MAAAEPRPPPPSGRRPERRAARCRRHFARSSSLRRRRPHRSASPDASNRGQLALQACLIRQLINPPRLGAGGGRGVSTLHPADPRRRGGRGAAAGITASPEGRGAAPAAGWQCRARRGRGDAQRASCAAWWACRVSCCWSLEPVWFGRGSAWCGWCGVLHLRVDSVVVVVGVVLACVVLTSTGVFL